MTWLYLPSLESPCAPASGCSMRDAASHSSTLGSITGLSLTSKGKLLLPRSLSRLWNRVAWMQRLSGLTSPPSTASAGAARWIASLLASRASLTASPGNALASRMIDGSGQRLPALLAMWDRASSCWKTSQASLLPEDSAPASAILPPSGSMRSGGCYLRPTLELHTRASDCSSSHGRWDMPDTMPEMPNSGSNRKAQVAGLGNQARSMWPSTRAEDSESCGNHPEATDSLTGATRNWPTPCANDDNKSPQAHMAMKSRMKGGPRNSITSLQVLVQTDHWKTPHGMSGVDHTGKVGSGGEFAKQATTWATPRTISGGAESSQRKKALGRLESGGGDLQAQSQQWPTPAARDMKGANSEEHALVTGAGRKHMDQLANYVAHSPRVQAINHGPESSPQHHTSPRRLNPAFAAWLMGFPWWWVNPALTSSVQSEMASWRSQQRALMCNLLGEPAGA